MSHRSIFQLAFILILTSLLLSCADKKKIIYFQGKNAIVNDTSKKYNPIYKAGDLLSIIIMSQDADAVKPFNLSDHGSFSTSGNTSATNYTNVKGYLIDQWGYIDFPVLGKISLSGLNRSQANEIIRIKLTEYVKDPSVHIELLNFKVTVLGDVGKPGVYTISGDRITLVEAIGMAGDLNITGLRKNILVIRDMNGIKTETRVDLTSKEVFSSPVYFLQQNDVIYVEHNRSRKNGSVINPTAITLILSFTTLGITLLNLVIRK